MAWTILTNKNVSVIIQETNSWFEYETTANDDLAANMACNMCMAAKSRKYRRPSKICPYHEAL